MTRPLVSVIVPVYNGRGTVGWALESVFAQTLPPEQLEAIVVDDGSTDGTADLLDELARTHDRLTVIHQPNSGGAGAPRNRGMERASGTFVFFLDADDRLHPEALHRMTAMAERNGTDIVLGKQVGTGGRKVPDVFGRTIERTHVLDPDCDLFPRMSMAALQLFRRSLIDRAGLRFTENLLSHEDQLFTAGAYLHAAGVSVLADHDCYYWAARADGTSSTQVGGAATADVHAIAGRAMTLVAEHTEPGATRERLLFRYLLLEVFVLLEQRYLESSAEDRESTLKGCRELLETWLTPTLLTHYRPRHRVLAHCLLHHLDAELAEVLRFHRDGRRPRVHLEDGRAYLKYPFFRDAAETVPDGCFEMDEPPRLRHDLTRVEWANGTLLIGGEALLRDVDGGADDVALELELVLTDGTGAVHRVRCETTSAVGTEDGLAAIHEATLTPGRLPNGRWAVGIEASLAGHVLRAPLTKPRGTTVPDAALVESEGRWRLVRPLPLATRQRGRLELEVGGDLTPADLRITEAAFRPDAQLRVGVEMPPVRSAGASPVVSAVLRHAEGGDVLRVPLLMDPGRPSVGQADISFAGARVGRWRLSLEVDGVGGAVPGRLPDSGAELLGPVTTSLIPPRRVHLRPGRGPLVAQVTDPLAARLRRLRRNPLKHPAE